MAKIVNGVARSTIRFSVESEDHHKKAYEIVESKKKKNEFMVQAILEKEFKKDLFEQLREIVREELAHISFSLQATGNNGYQQPIAQAQPQTPPQAPPQAPEEAIPEDALDFLNQLGKKPTT